MSEKRDVPVGFKLSESDKVAADAIAAKYGHKPGSLAGVLLREFLKAHAKYGENLKFPPAYDFYEEGSVVGKKSDSANKKYEKKAG